MTSLWQTLYVPEPPSRGRWAMAALAAAVFMAMAALLVWRSEPSTADWAADMALKIHAALDDDRTVTLAPLPPPPPPQPAPEPPSTGRPGSRNAAHPSRVPTRDEPSRPPPPGPVRAAALAGAAPPDEALDFSSMGFVAGQAKEPVSGAVSAGAPPGARGAREGRGASENPDAVAASGGDRKRAVSLAEDAWDCAWPASADEHERDEATVELSVRVGGDGRVTAVRVLRDPGLGFGDAARTCALRTTFQPARDAAGTAIAAWSPPIRVTFRR